MTEFTLAANDGAWRAYERYQKAAGHSPRTRQSWREAGTQLETWAAARPSARKGKRAAAAGADLLAMSRADLEDFIGHIVETRSAATAAVRYRGLHSFYAWAADPRRGDLIETSPMAGMPCPKTGDRAPVVASDDDIAALVAACRKGRGFEDRRDLALVTLMLAYGAPRASELAALKVTDVDPRQELVKVVDGKGGKSRVFPMSEDFALALMRYLPLRQAHPHAGCEQLFVGTKGPMTRFGVAQMLKRRCRQAGIAPVGPHRLRHRAAHDFFTAGGSEGNAMMLFGWSSITMPQLYARHSRVSRAIDDARARAPRRLAG
jgi:site-specific recombinase XerD